jgi:periplasmic divalent cation tolerance protein
MNPEALVVLCTAPPADGVAETLARGLVEAKLAACVNLIPGVRSFYAWKGQLHEDGETQLLIKTRPELFQDVERFIREHHPYELPEVIALPIALGSAPYLEWLRGQTSA